MQKILGFQEHTYNDKEMKKSPLFPEMNVNRGTHSVLINVTKSKCKSALLTLAFRMVSYSRIA